MELGNRLEGFVAELFTEETGLKVRNVNGILANENILLHSLTQIELQQEKKHSQNVKLLTAMLQKIGKWNPSTL